MTPNTTSPDGEETDSVYVIQSWYHHRDIDNRPTTDIELREDEGWFASAESADARCEQLNSKNRELYDVAMSRATRDQNARIQAAENTNAENAVLRQAGFQKRDVPVPTPFVAPRFEDWTPSGGHTTYAVLPIKKSEHDGISPASEVDAKT
ncbi:hypothetical protein OVA26_16455 [Microbacterium sp. SL62]|uniref:hypothetical protein n=1 Tax=Microbacterium sp. SL62 TaxID=2995139 RepID=UPI002275E44B|nr:hypothetical protein [Microbacterium sp. SL62]MCY1718529.1 hypothetical protein [Microbacterium sp. SL62]